MSEAESVVSFRDPAGRLLLRDGRIFRLVRREALPDLEHFLESAAAQRLTADGRLVRTIAVEKPAGQTGEEAWYEHERIPFPSYPYEWPPEMLHQAGCLTIELALSLLVHGLGLKDGTPYNVLFRGPTPVFVDVLSVERRTAGDPTWLPYAQFIRTFLLPLAVNRDLRLSVADLLAGRRDGLEPESVYHWLGPWQRLRPPYLTLVSIPAWLAHSAQRKEGALYERRQLSDPEKAQFVLETLLRGLQKHLHKLQPARNKSSQWSGYMSSHSYGDQDFADKEQFVREFLQEFAPANVLDAGCNDGHFSVMAARAGARVVAIDYDENVVGIVWRRAAADRLDILPLVVNLTRPTPPMGWRNRESASFLERAHAGFEAVFFLALIHHMLVSERIPLSEILALAAELTTGFVVMEYVSPQDTMFRQLTRGREHLHQDLTEETFEAACRKHFDILRSRPLMGGRRHLYLLRKLA
ncbi:MAG: SAM-dependent methyltransferase [Acidobacteriia bacterium]|nr:SAM-dependent methyltransferase [Terriglobia bacterium]